MIETQQYAMVPVEKLLASIKVRPNYAEIVSVAKLIATAMRSAKERVQLGDFEILPLPSSVGRAALRYKVKKKRFISLLFEFVFGLSLFFANFKTIFLVRFRKLKTHCKLIA